MRCWPVWLTAEPSHERRPARRRDAGKPGHDGRPIHGGHRSKARRFFSRNSRATRRRSIRFDAICEWAASLGYKGVQIPDLGRAAVRSRQGRRVEDLLRRDRRASRRATGSRSPNLSTHLQGQLVAVNPAYDEAFDAFAPPEVHGKPGRAAAWAVEQMLHAGQGVAQSRPDGACHLLRRAGVAVRLSLAAARAGADRDGVRRTRPALAADPRRLRRGRLRRLLRDPSRRGHFRRRDLRAVSGGGRRPQALRINYDPSHFLLQQLDYLAFIDIYHERIKAFHVKDAEFNPTGRQGVYSGYAPWVERAGRFRSLGDGQVDFGAIFSKMAQYGYSSWAVLEWECCLKHPEDGAREGAEFIAAHIIRVTEKAFDDFAGGAIDQARIKRALGIEAEGGRSMAIEGRSDARRGGRIRLGMVGGGEGAFIGAVHRIAARIDDQYELVAGALSSTPEKARRSGAGARPRARPRLRRLREHGQGRSRRGRTASRRWRSSRPTMSMLGPTYAFLKAGIHVICDKPLTLSLAEAQRRCRRRWRRRDASSR